MDFKELQLIQACLDDLNSRLHFSQRGHEGTLTALLGDGSELRFEVVDGELIIARIGESW